jgi:pimeloyl-ACP methyl ester carboxylesterase
MPNAPSPRCSPRLDAARKIPLRDLIMTTTLDLAAQIFGEGPPVLILHGLFGSQRNWGGIIRALATDVQIHGLDLRNHGESPWAESMTYDEMAADAGRYIEKNALGAVTLLGHSMGGKVGMRLALTRPDLLSRLIVVDIAPVSYHNEHYSDYVAAMQALPLDRLTRRAEADEALKPAIPDDSLRAFLLQNMVSDGGHFRWRINLANIGANMKTLIAFPHSAATFDAPAFFLAGERSNYIRPRDRESIVTLFPQAEIQEIPDSGHWPHAEHPERFLAMVRPLLKG